MKKQMITLILGILLVGTVIAGGLILNNREISLTKTEKQDLESINLGNYNTVDYEKDGLYQRCLSKEICSYRIIEGCYFNPINETDSVYICENKTIPDCESFINTCSRYMNKSSLDSWEEARIKNIANATAERRLRNNPEKVKEGVTTIKDK